MAQRVQPGQRLCRADSNRGPQRAAHSWPGPQAPLDRQHGRLLLHEEPAALHISEPLEAGVVTLPQHQVGPVYSLKPLHQIQQSTAGAREGAARAEPSISAAVQRLRYGAWQPRDCSRPCIFGANSNAVTEVFKWLPPFEVAVSIRGWNGFKPQIIAFKKEKTTVTWLHPLLPAKVELWLTAANWDLRMSQKWSWRQCNLRDTKFMCLLMSTEKDTLDYIISPSIPSPFLWQDGAFHSFAFVPLIPVSLHIYLLLLTWLLVSIQMVTG